MSEFFGDLNYITYIFWFLAGLSNGVMDTLQFHYNESILDRMDGDKDTFNPDKSWLNKYKDLGESYLINLFERLRMTALVFTTDLWHLMQWFMLTFFALSFLFYTPSDYILFEIAFLRFVPFQLGFTLMYDKLLPKRKI